MGTTMIEFENGGGATGRMDSIELDAKPPVDPDRPPEAYPRAMLKGLKEEDKVKLVRWLDERLSSLKSSHASKTREWIIYEEAYKAPEQAEKKFPFKGACNDVVPVIAMAVDPIVARLDVGVFKQDPVFRLKGLKKSTLEAIPALERWVDYYQRHKLKLRQVFQPRLFEFTKLGTMAFKTVYDHEEYKIKTYNSKFEVESRKEIRFSGPRVFGIDLDNLYFDPIYQTIHDCPLVAERQPTTYFKLKRAESSEKIIDVEKIKLHYDQRPNGDVAEARSELANHPQSGLEQLHDLVVWECWFDYDIDNDGIPERLVAHYHEDSRTLLSLRYNWYFHQKVPYTVIPYTVTNNSIYGIGLCEMALPFQVAATRWHQMASDNAYIANIRMYVAKKNSGIEEVPRLYAGRVFFVDDPGSDFKPFQAGEIYPSTITERQNLFGLVEKRTGVSDYLTGRESPIVGSRATATSTVALIQEGTKRVEQVLENIRLGAAEILENCFSIWIQYGLEGLEDLVFGDDEVAKIVRDFFDSLSQENVNGAIAVDLTATDANANRAATQQVQLQIIQIMMQYLEKLLAAGAGAIQAKQQQPELAELITEVMTASRKMFKDLLVKYDIKNPEDYLPDLAKFMRGEEVAPVGPNEATQGGPPGLSGRPGGPPVEPSVPPVSDPSGGASGAPGTFISSLV